MLEVVPKAELTVAKEELSVEARSERWLRSGQERLVAATKAKEEGNAQFKAARMRWEVCFSEGGSYKDAIGVYLDAIYLLGYDVGLLSRLSLHQLRIAIARRRDFGQTRCVRGHYES